MRIGMIAPPWLPVPPPAYGGTEAVLDGLVRGLVQAGHEVVLAAHPDSQTPAEIRSVLPRGSTDAIGQGATELAHVVAAYEQLTDVDVIHDHTLSGPLLGPRRTGVPIVATHHGVFDDATTRIFRDVARSAKVIAISHCQAAGGGRHPHRRRRAPRDRRRGPRARGRRGWLPGLPRAHGAGEGPPPRHPHRPAAGDAPAARGQDAGGAGDGLLRGRGPAPAGRGDRVHRRARPRRQGAAAVRSPRPAQPHRLAGAVRDGDARGARLRHAGRGAGRGRGAGDRGPRDGRLPRPHRRRARGGSPSSWTGSTA